MQTFQLRTNSLLLNPHFEGYKLYGCDDIIKFSKTTLEGVVEIEHESVGYLRTKLKSLHNHLYCDGFHIYYFSKKLHLVQHSVDKGSVLSEGKIINLECSIFKEDSKEVKYFPSIKFPCSDIAVISFGQGDISLYDTGDRGSNVLWKEVFRISFPGILIQSHIQDCQDLKILNCLILSVTSLKELEQDQTNYIKNIKHFSDASFHIIFWITLSNSDGVWKIIQERRVVGMQEIHYCSLDEKAENLILLSHSFYYFIYDSSGKLSQSELNESKSVQIKYVQNSDEICIQIYLDSKISKSDLNINLSCNSLSVKVADNFVISGTFLHNIKSCDSIWTFENGVLEVTALKVENGLSWTSLFETPSLCALEVDNFEDTESSLTVVTDTNKLDEKSIFNSDELEACDEASEDLFLLILNGKSNSLLKYADLGSVQHLYNVKISSYGIPAFCLRRDVDGIVWQPIDGGFEHEYTNNAFGYVKASKTMAKFTVAPEDMSYIAIADVRTHIYVFHQSGLVDCNVKNRKTGKQPDISKQSLLSLQDHNEILGLQAFSNMLSVLTNETLYLYILKQ